MKERSLKDYFRDIMSAIKEIEDFVKGMAYSDFAKDRKTINAVVRSIEVIGEATKKIPKNTKEKYKDIPWKKMAGMRDKLIHEYFGIDLEILWGTIKQDIPPLKSLFEKILKDF